jgi:uncharacterized protein
MTEPIDGITAAVAALGIGLSLGLLGGGGSILTVPVFVYALGVPTTSAVAMSMPVVGLTSLVGVLSHWRAGHVRWRTAFSFGTVAMVAAFGGTWIGRRLGGDMQLLLLATLMSITAVAMWRRPASSRTSETAAATRHPVFLLLVAIGVGVLTGVVGIGGGFLVVPALVVLGGLPMTDAIGTSLAVIVLNAAAGLAGYAGHVLIDWSTVLWFTALAATGIVAGSRLAPRVPAATLRRAFALLLLVVGALLLWPRLLSLSS